MFCFYIYFDNFLTLRGINFGLFYFIFNFTILEKISVYQVCDKLPNVASLIIKPKLENTCQKYVYFGYDGILAMMVGLIFKHGSTFAFKF